jgi:hypothetical protein
MISRTRIGKGVIIMAKFFSTDKIIAIGLVLALIISFFVSTSTEIQATIAGGLVGYLGKVGTNNDNIKRLIADELAQRVVTKIVPDIKK